MKKDDVPQDAGILGDKTLLLIAFDESGEPAPTPSKGWDPINVANAQAWEDVQERLEAALRDFQAGKVSALACHMAAAQMDEAMLAQYIGLPVRTVRSHLTPTGAREIGQALKERYAALFRVAPAELDSPPKRT